MKFELTDRNLQRYHLTGTLVVVVVLALALAGSLLWIGLTEYRQITQRFEQAQQGFTPLLGPETVTLPLTTLVSTGLPAMAMIHHLKGSHPQSDLVFHPIKKSHFHQRKSQHFFTRLGQVKP